MSSEPDSSNGHGQTASHQIELQDLEENKPEKHRPISYLKRALVQDRHDGDDLYSFKGFMLFCFGAPGVSPHWCSKFSTQSIYHNVQSMCHKRFRQKKKTSGYKEICSLSQIVFVTQQAAFCFSTMCCCSLWA